MDIEYTNPQSAPEPSAPAAAPESPAPEAPRVRRVGTFTMGITMILVGLLIVCSMFGWGMQLEWVFRLAPLILVALGVEVLIGAFSQGTKLKYDFLSIIVCGILTLAALGFSAVPFVLQYFGPAHEQAERRVESQVYEKVLNSMPGDGLEALNVSAVLQRPVQDTENVSLQTGDYLTVSVTLSASDEADFLAKAAKINAALADTKTSSVSVYYTSTVKDGAKWELQVYDRLQLDDTVDQMKTRLRTLHETEYGWMTDEEAAAEAENHESELEQQASNYEAQLEEQRVSYEGQLEEQQASYENELEQQRGQYEQQIEALQQQLDEQNAA